MLRRLLVLAGVLVVCLSVSASRLGAAAGGSGGSGHTVLLLPDGTVWTAGWNDAGQIGDGTQGLESRPRSFVLSGAVSVAAGGSYTLAALADGSVKAWGHGYFGQLGDNTGDNHYLPITVPTLSGVVAVAAGWNYSLALQGGGTVYTFGSNGSSGLGDGTTNQRLAPVLVSGLSNAVAIAAGHNHSLAVRSDGTVVAWGSNQYGKLGDGTTTTRLTPTPVSGLTDVVAVAAGDAHSLALDGTGHVYAWGQGERGRLGTGTTTEAWTPVPVPGLTNVTAIAAGNAHSVALVNGQVWTWGANDHGAIGSGTTTATYMTPVQVPGLPTIVAIAAGDEQTFAFAADGGVWGWGLNGFGQLGDGATDDSRLSPTVLAEAGGAWRVAVPRFSVTPGTYTTPRTVLITSATPSATVHYTNTGADPTETDPVPPTGGVVVDQSRTLKARAWKSGMPPSAIITAAYTLRAATPTINPSPTLYTTPQTVTFGSSTTDATIRFTLDGTEPQETSPAYEAPFPVSTGTTVKVKAFKSGWDPSTLAQGTYTFNYGTLATPTASPAGGTYHTDQTITLNGPSGATLRYTLDGSTPGTSSPVYTAPITITTSGTLKARAFQTDWTASSTLTETYALKVATPTFTQASGAHAPGQVVAIATNTPGATIRYTLNGTTPTTSDPVLTPGGTLTLGTFTLKAVAWRTGYVTSDVASATYSLTGDLTATRIAAGHTHSVALRNDGTVWTAGANGYGGLGDGTTTQRLTPVMVAGLTGSAASARVRGTRWRSLSTDGSLPGGRTFRANLATGPRTIARGPPSCRGWQPRRRWQPARRTAWP